MTGLELPGHRDRRTAPHLTLSKLAALITSGGAVGALMVSVISWIGWLNTSPAARLLAHEVRIREDRAYTDSVAEEAAHALADSMKVMRVEVTWLGQLVEATATKSCLDADGSALERRNLARAGVPCLELYRRRGIQP